MSTCLKILGRTGCVLLAPGLGGMHTEALSPLPSTEPLLHAAHSKEPPDIVLSPFTNCGACPPGTQVQRVCDPSGLPAKWSWASHRSSLHLTFPQVSTSHCSVAAVKENCQNQYSHKCLFEVNTWHYRM